MTVLASVSLPGGSVSPTIAGAEIEATRRIIDFSDISSARLSYGGSGVGDCALGISYTLNQGGTWTSLIPKGPSLAASGVVLPTVWTDVSVLQGGGDIIIAAFAYSVSAVTGLLYTVKFIDLQLR